MKTYLLLGIFFLLVLSSCEKSSNDPSKNNEEEVLSVTDYYPLTTGSCWVYDTYEIDSLGNETLRSEKDTVEILGDTLIREINYKVFYGKPLNLFTSPKVKYFRRDSSGYIVDESGWIVFQTVDIQDTSYIHPQWADGRYYYYCYMEKHASDYTDFSKDSVVSSNLAVYKVDESEMLLGVMEEVYVPGVGLVQDQCAYITMLDKQHAYWDTRLTEYLIKE